MKLGYSLLSQTILMNKSTQISFLNWIKDERSPQLFAGISFIICLAYYALETFNGRAQMADFRVYYDAANAFLNDTQLYGKAFGVSSGFYKYSPFACLPFVPLAVLPYKIASFIFYLLISGSIIWFSLYLYKSIVGERYEKTGWIVGLTALYMADHLERELHLGNINLFLLIAAFWIFTFLKNEKQLFAGLLYGLLLLFKPHFLILLPYFIWKKQWKASLISVAFVLVGLLLPALLKGWTGNLHLVHDWFAAMRDHSIKLEESPNTIYGIFNHFILRQTGHPISIVILLGITSAWFLFFLIKNKMKFGNTDVRFIEFFILVALIPNLVHTDTEHFMWTWPLIAFIIIELFKKKNTLFNSEGLAVIVLFTISFIPYCLNSPDLVGKKLRFLFDEGGLLGIANLFIIAAAVLLVPTKSHNHTL
jgi:hypothetical protein